ncbi:FAD dependent oxidoreductase superfamily [Penicillium brasilianum]|uniref:FAD dependent oxidoreductase superfamily n=1 Tax=Penicillium brasilianum TaxID=104259 RepID=A0A1S9RCH4_PENBI|nr:FAD dependent oxidoreductase superfamily [Penicillium brasilianum]
MPARTQDLPTRTRDSSSQCFPANNPGETFWQSTRHKLHDHRSTEQLPKHSDIVIVGAGYAGVSTAYHLVKDHGDVNKSITILEARGACSGATGRNGGHARPDFYGHIPTYIDRAGARAGAEIAEFEINNLRALKKIIEQEKIDCDFTLARSIDVWCNAEAAEKAKSVYDRIVAEGFEYMDDVVFYTGDTVEGICGVKGAKACASFTAGTMWPYKFIMHLVELIVDAGINLQTNTPVTSVTADPEGGFAIETPRGKMHAGKVVYANNAYVSGLLPQYKKNIVPCKGICCRITVPDGVTAPLLNNSYINRTEDNVLSYLIPRADGSIVVGGAAAVFRAHENQWYDNVDDSILIDSAKDYYIDYMQKTYHGWEDTGARIDKIWSGVMGYSYDSNPHIGNVPGGKDQYILAGFNGHGMPVIWLSSKELAKMIVQDIPFEQTTMPRLFQTSQLRIDRALNGKTEDGDILGSGKFPATKP